MHHRVQIEPLELLRRQGHRGWNLRQPRHTSIFKMLGLGVDEVVVDVHLIRRHDFEVNWSAIGSEEKL